MLGENVKQKNKILNVNKYDLNGVAFVLRGTKIVGDYFRSEPRPWRGERRQARVEGEENGGEKNVLSENSFAGRTFSANMKLNERDPGRRAIAAAAVAAVGGGREMCDRKEEKRERVDGGRGLNVENASAEKRERDKEYTLRVHARYTRRAVGEGRRSGWVDAAGPRVPTEAAAAAGRVGRRKRGLVVLVLIEKHLLSVVLSLCSSNKRTRETPEGGKRGRKSMKEKRNGARKRRGKEGGCGCGGGEGKTRALRYYFGSLIIFSSALLDLREGAGATRAG